MTGFDPRRAQRRLLQAVLAAGILLLCHSAAAQKDSAINVQLYWQETATVPISGVTQAVSLDSSICEVQLKDESLKLVGLARGETVVLAWVGTQRTALRVHVVERPPLAVRPQLSKAQVEALGHGNISSAVVKADVPGAGTSLLFQEQLDWTQKTGDRALSLRMQTQSSTLGDAPRFNLTSGSIQYATARWNTVLLDFLFTPGGPQASITPMPAFNPMPLRGADVAFTRGRNRIEAFAGSTLPAFYLSLAGTRSLAGVTFGRTQSDRLYLYSTAGYASVPLFTADLKQLRQTSEFLTGGFSFRWTPRWSLQGMGGISTRGALAQGGVSYVGARMTVYANGSNAAAHFPLSDMQMLFGGGRSISAGGSYKLSQSAQLSGYFQHSTSASGAAVPGISSGTYLNPNLALRLSRSQQLTLNYAYNSTQQGPQALRGSRFSALLNSTPHRRMANTAEFVYDTAHDPTQVKSQASLSVRDVVTLPMRFGSLSVGGQHTRSDPSTAARLAGQLQLLTPEMREQFLLDPAAFANSPNLPPSVRILLNNLQPSNAEAFVGAQFRVGRRLSLSPSFRFHRDSGLALNQVHNSMNMGYSLVYQVNPGLQIFSTLSDAIGFDTRSDSLQRTTVFTAGVRKSLTGAVPVFAIASANHTIRGRVCVDTAVQGHCSPNSPGLPGIKVHLDQERSVITDRQGRFAFSKTGIGEHHVWLELSQFSTPVRVTTATDVDVDTARGSVPDLSFGIVNFARLMGNVFNDYLLDADHQPDAPGLKGVRLTVKGMGVQKTLVTDGAGDYEIDDLPPGQYQLTVDRSTVPVNFVAPSEAVTVQVAPTATAVHDIGLRALRSLSGRVYIRSMRVAEPAAVVARRQGKTSYRVDVAKPEYTLEPLHGVLVNIAGREAETNDDGVFLIRDLPAGELNMTLVARAPLPPGAQLPSGTFRMPKDPIQVRDVKVVVTNMDLVTSLVEPLGSAPSQPDSHPSVGAGASSPTSER